MDTTFTKSKKTEQRPKKSHYVWDRHVRKIYLLLSIIGMLVFLAVVALLEGNGNVRAADETSKLLLNEVEDVLNRNTNSEDLLTESLKEDYITRAKAVAYILNEDPSLIENRGELVQIAELIGVDEINIFNPEGVIYAGTVVDYYGVSINDGDQVYFFHDMLEDQTLSLCQDMMPNTKAGKSMMYAMTWMKAGTAMVQVGIEPERLVEELSTHKVQEVVDSMPMTEGLGIYVVDHDTGQIVGATNTDQVGKTLDEIGLTRDDSAVDKSHTKTVDGVAYRLYFTVYEDYGIGIMYRMNVIQKGLARNLILVFAILIIFTGIISVILTRYEASKHEAEEEIAASHRERDDQLAILTSMSGMYFCMYFIDLVNKKAREYNATKAVASLFNEQDDIKSMMDQMMSRNCNDASRDEMLEFVNLDTIANRMKGVKSVYKDFHGVHGRWCRATFTAITTDPEDRPTAVMFAVQTVDDEKRREEILLLNSNTDALTRCLNRRAFEEEIARVEKTGMPKNFTIIAMDVNGLKEVNDSLGHTAGDELILGAAGCMQESFGPYGHIYRTGGDEFIALLTVDGKKLAELIKDFMKKTEYWHGRVIKTISIACGYAQASDLTEEERKTNAVARLGTLADEHMYAAKANYYATRGVDRRGQSRAYTAIKESYLKILKVDLAADSYQIIQVQTEEKEKAWGFADSFSGWVQSFDRAERVAKEDRELFLTELDRESLLAFYKKSQQMKSISYDRRVGDEIHRVLLELVPAENFTSDHPVLYLYVKKIE